MKDRIRRIMEDQKMSQKDFALKCGISDATLSQVFSGKTGATQKTVQKVLSAFPSVSLSWLMYGKGPMYENAPSVSFVRPAEQTGADDSLFWGETSVPETPVRPLAAAEGAASFAGMDAGGVDPGAPAAETAAAVSGRQETFSGGFPADRPRNFASSRQPAAQQSEIVKYFDKPERKIKEIRIFFDDGTYEIFVPQGK